MRGSGDEAHGTKKEARCHGHCTDTEPPEEARPDTTRTPLLVEDGKLLPPAVRFTAVALYRWLEYLADKHGKLKMSENAWDYVLAIVIRG